MGGALRLVSSADGRPSPSDESSPNFPTSVPPRRKRVRVPKPSPSLLAAAKVRAIVDAVGNEGDRVTIHDSDCPVHADPERDCDCEAVTLDVWPRGAA